MRNALHGQTRNQTARAGRGLGRTPSGYEPLLAWKPLPFLTTKRAVSAAFGHAFRGKVVMGGSVPSPPSTSFCGRVKWLTPCLWDTQHPATITLIISPAV